MRFVVDAMLGTCAKWLRILGYDAVFDATWDDHQLVRLSRAEDRVLLTRDRQLALRRGVRVLLIESENLEDQLRQVLDELDLEPNHSFSRCPVCNEPLRNLDPEEARPRVPPYIAQTHRRFKTCPQCHRVYWRGTHWEHMEQRVTHLQTANQSPGAGDAQDSDRSQGG